MRRQLVCFGVVAATAGVCAWRVFFEISPPGSEVEANPWWCVDCVDVMVAATNLQAGQQLRAQDIAIVKVPLAELERANQPFVDCRFNQCRVMLQGRTVDKPIRKGERLPVSIMAMEARNRAAQNRIYQESIRAEWIAAEGTPDCLDSERERLTELGRQLEAKEWQICGENCPELLPIPAEHEPTPMLRKTSSGV